MSFEAYLTDAATIQVRAPTRGGYTDTTPAWSTVAAGVPCRDTNLRDEIVIKQGRDAQDSWHRVYFGRDLAVDLSRRHRLVVNGKVLEIRASHDVLALGRVVQVDCREAKA